MDYTGGFNEPPQPPTPPIRDENSTPVGSSSAEPAPADPAYPTLDQELASVMKGIGSFWGKVRKQSVAAYETAEKQIDTARKDLSPLVSKARANLDQFSDATKAELQRLSEAGSQNSTSMVIGADGTPIYVESPKVDKGKGVDRSGSIAEGSTSPSVGADEDEPTPAAAAVAFLSNLQSQIVSNPNIGELTTNLQKSLTTVQSNLSHLPSSFQTNLTNLQAQLPHIDAKIAENYLQQGEHWLADFTEEVGRRAKDAIRVVPPTAAEAKKSEERAKDQVAVGRKDTLVFRLRGDRELLLVDPAQSPPPAPAPVESLSESTSTPQPPPDLRESFSRFLQAIEDRGGFEGESFAAQVKEERSDSTLNKTFVELVPSKLTQEAFWSRYFFRKALIEDEEKRRKKVLEGAAAATVEEDFNWDEEDDEEEAPVAPAPSSDPIIASIPVPTVLPTSSSSASLSTPIPGVDSASVSAPDTPKIGSDPPAVPTADGNLEEVPGPRSHSPVREHSSSSTAEEDKKSPRVSSDGASSYDVVGAQSGNPSEGEPETEVVEKVRSESDGEDSDWE